MGGHQFVIKIMSSTDIPLDKIRFALFNTTASRYDQIMTAFGPLAFSLIKLADLRPHEQALDLGTGTGAVAFPAAERACQVVAIDYAPTMLRQARQQPAHASQSQKLLFTQGDMYRLPHPSGYFDVVLASFGFNGVRPDRAFLETWRVLKNGGRLVFQEWGRVDRPSKLVKQAVNARKVAQASGFLADLRRLGAAPKAWDQLGGAEGVYDLLKVIGFQRVKTSIHREAIPFEPRAFFEYKTAWAPYQAELNAMSPESRAAVENEAISQLQALPSFDGRFIWRPELLHVIAWK